MRFRFNMSVWDFHTAPLERALGWVDHAQSTFWGGIKMTPAEVSRVNAYVAAVKLELKLRRDRRYRDLVTELHHDQANATNYYLIIADWIEEMLDSPVDETTRYNRAKEMRLKYAPHIYREVYSDG